MKLESALRTARELKEAGGETAIVIAAIDRLKEYHDNFDTYGYSIAQKRLSDKGRVLLGLVFSEFLAEDNSDRELIVASEKQRVLHSTLQLDARKIFEVEQEIAKASSF